MNTRTAAMMFLLLASTMGSGLAGCEGEIREGDRGQVEGVAEKVVIDDDMDGMDDDVERRMADRFAPIWLPSTNEEYGGWGSMIADCPDPIHNPLCRRIGPSIFQIPTMWRMDTSTQKVYVHVRAYGPHEVHITYMRIYSSDGGCFGHWIDGHDPDTEYVKVGVSCGNTSIPDSCTPTKVAFYHHDERELVNWGQTNHDGNRLYVFIQTDKHASYKTSSEADEHTIFCPSYYQAPDLRNYPRQNVGEREHPLVGFLNPFESISFFFFDSTPPYDDIRYEPMGAGTECARDWPVAPVLNGGVNGRSGVSLNWDMQERSGGCAVSTTEIWIDGGFNRNAAGNSAYIITSARNSFKVRQRTTSGEVSPFSNEVALNPGDYTLPRPYLANVSATMSSITIYWGYPNGTDLDGFGGFHIFRNGCWAGSASGSAARSFTDGVTGACGPMTPGAAYTYFVRAFTYSGANTDSIPAQASTAPLGNYCAPPNQPGARVADLGNGQYRVDVSFFDGTTSENRFKIARSVDGSPTYTVFRTVEVYNHYYQETRTVQDFGTTCGHTYRYKVLLERDTNPSCLFWGTEGVQIATPACKQLKAVE